MGLERIRVISCLKHLDRSFPYGAAILLAEWHTKHNHEIPVHCHRTHSDQEHSNQESVTKAVWENVDKNGEKVKGIVTLWPGWAFYIPRAFASEASIIWSNIDRGWLGVLYASGCEHWETHHENVMSHLHFRHGHTMMHEVLSRHFNDNPAWSLVS